MPYTFGSSQCLYRCSDHSVKQQRYYCEKGSLKVVTGWDEIINELKNGPMMVGLMIYEDFLSYESGVY